MYQKRLSRGQIGETMLVKLTEHYQDARVHYTPEQEVDVDSTLGAWLVEHRKAIRLEVTPKADYYTTVVWNTTPATDIIDAPHPVDEPVAPPTADEFKEVAELMNNAEF